jgi:hypothetical protein
MLVGAVGGFLLSRNDRSSASRSCDVAPARISSCEWCADSWRGQSTREQFHLAADRTVTEEIVINDFPSLWQLATST